MTVQKGIALLILVMSIALAGWVLQDVAFTGVLGLLAFIGLKRKYTWDIKPQQRVLSSILVLLLLGLFSLHYHYSSPPPDTVPAVLAWQTVSRFFFSAMILVLFLGKSGVLPPSLGAFFLATVISAGQVLLLWEHEVIYRPLEFLSVILAALYACSDTEQRPAGLNPHHRRIKSRVWVFGIILLLALNTGWMFGAFLYRNHGTVNILSNLLWGDNPIIAHANVKSSTVGFTDRVQLSNLQHVLQSQDKTVQLRIQASRNPEYLRARSFDSYDFRTSQWLDRSHYPQIYGEDIPGFSLGGPKRNFNLSRLNPANFTDTQTLEIQHEVGFQQAMFAPLGVLNLQWNGDYLMHSEYTGTFYNDNEHNRAISYKILYSPSACLPPTDIHLRQALYLPQHLDPRIENLAQSILGSCRTTEKKIDAVVKHFADNYSYSLTVSLPPEEEPLTGFLLHGDAGYCEYFASGAALLLRIGGVPTRYVTGFLIHQFDYKSESWVAQAGDAHAWIEAWDSSKERWITVEATVADEADSTAETTDQDDSQEHRQINLRQLIQGLYDYGLAGPLVQFLRKGGLWGVLSFTLGIVLSVGLTIRYWIVTSKRLKGLDIRTHSLNNQVQDLHKQLRRLEKRLLKFDRPRSPQESLLRYSQRLEQSHETDEFGLQVALWLRRYNSIRYSPQLAHEQIQALGQDLETLLKIQPESS